MTADVIVVGGGPAGLMAAGTAAGAGATVTLLEGEERPGKKLLVTGKGRCNLTNTLPLERFLEGFGRNGAFLRNGFHRFFSGELRSFLAGIGVETAVERGGRVYPASGGAAAALDALVAWARSLGVAFVAGRRVKAIAAEDAGGLVVSGGGPPLRAARVVIAAGGASWPQTGSRGDGAAIAAALGHRIVPLRPALVPVVCREAFVRQLSGVKLRNVRLTVRPAQGRAEASFGEVHFTPFGISGPAVFPPSRRIGELAKGGPVPLAIDFKPALDEAKLDARLRRELELPGRADVGEVLASLLPRRLVPVFLEVAGLDAGFPAARVGRETRRRIASLLQAFPLTATGTLPIEKGMVTAGGVDLREVDPGTMASRVVPGLYFAGEVLDLDGDTGGYNLQAAFTTGRLAGLAVATPPAGPAAGPA